jgi:2,4-diaminopentanoate dehydrogenase
MAPRVALYGFGKVGQLAGELLARRDGVEVVAVIGRSNAGRPARALVPELSEALVIQSDAATALERSEPDVVLHATVPSLEEALPQIMLALERDCSVISTCEELAFPWIVHRRQAEQLDTAARQHGVAVLGTGVNPGYVFDALVLYAMSPRWRPSRVEVSRVTDASAFGDAVRGRLGLGTRLDQFRAMTADGQIRGHIGFRESMDLCAAALGTHLESFREWFEPMAAERDADGVVAGSTAGFEQRAAGRTIEGLVFDFRITVHLWPGSLGLEVVDTIRVVDGDQRHELEVRPACAPVETAAAQLVNAIPHVLAAQAGLRSGAEMRAPTPWVTWPLQSLGT